MQHEFRTLKGARVSADSAIQASSDKNPAEEFLKWFDQQSGEHRLELAEFVGYFCYKPLYNTFSTPEAKVFALKEYVNAFREDYADAVKLLHFIDQIIDFIMEINRDSESAYFSCEELISELSGISSLYSLLIDLPMRSRRWAFSFLQWQRFKASFSFFRNEMQFSPLLKERSQRSPLQPDPAILSRANTKTSVSRSPLL